MPSYFVTYTLNSNATVVVSRQRWLVLASGVCIAIVTNVARSTNNCWMEESGEKWTGGCEWVEQRIASIWRHQLPLPLLTGAKQRSSGTLGGLVELSYYYKMETVYKAWSLPALAIHERVRFAFCSLQLRHCIARQPGPVFTFVVVFYSSPSYCYCH